MLAIDFAAEESDDDQQLEGVETPAAAGAVRTLQLRPESTHGKLMVPQSSSSASSSV